MVALVEELSVETIKVSVKTIGVTGVELELLELLELDSAELVESLGVTVVVTY